MHTFPWPISLQILRPILHTSGLDEVMQEIDADIHRNRPDILESSAAIGRVQFEGLLNVYRCELIAVAGLGGYQ